MSRPASPLPEEWKNEPFRVSDACERGLSAGRLSGRDLVAPFNSVRSTGLRLEQRFLAEAFALRHGDDQVLSHTTALLLWGAPLPRSVERESRIHVSSLGPARPRTRHTISHELAPDRTPIATSGSLRLTSPAVSWVLSAPLLGLDALIAAGDFLVTGTQPFDGAPPLTSIEELAATVAARQGDRGIIRAREALASVRFGPLSARETHGRLMMVRAGLPEPQLNFRVLHPSGTEIAMVDYAHLEFLSATEYESLLHLDPVKFRRDIRKQQELEAIGWAVHRLTADDVDPQLRTPASRAAVARIRATLVARGWRPPR